MLKDSYFYAMQKIKNEELGRKSIEEFKNSLKLPLVIVLDNIRSLNNVGSAFRTADAFLIEHIFLCDITGKPPHNEIQKTALGSTESVNWSYFKTTDEVIDFLKQRSYKVYAAEQVKNSISLNQFVHNKNEPIAVVFGNEIYGVDQEIINKCDGSIEIPQAGTKHSLNIAVSIGIVVWEIARKYC